MTKYVYCIETLEGRDCTVSEVYHDSEGIAFREVVWCGGHPMSVPYICDLFADEEGCSVWVTSEWATIPFGSPDWVID